MADNNDTFDVLIRTTADPTGAERAKQEIAEVKAEAEAANVGGKSGLASNFNGPLGEVEALAAADERRNSLLRQRQSIITSETELLVLQGEGENARAAQLAAEIEELKLALQIQQTTNLSEAEALALARERIAAETELLALEQLQAAAAEQAAAIEAALVRNTELRASVAAKAAAAATTANAEAAAGGLLAGVNVGKARQEATTLFREVATGTVNMRTVSALSGSLGTALGAGAIAGLALGEAISHIGKHLDETRITAEKESVEFQKQAEHWRAMAASAQSFADVQKLTEEVATRVSEINEKSRQLPSEVGSGLLDTMRNSAQIMSNAIRGYLGLSHDLETTTDEAVSKQRQLAEQVELTGRGFATLSQQNADFVAGVKGYEIAKQIELWGIRLGEFQHKQDEAARAGDTNTAHYRSLTAQIEAATKEITKLQAEQEKATQESEKNFAGWREFYADQQKAHEANTAATDKLRGKEGDELKQLQEIQKEAAKPNLPLSERLQLLERELKLLQEIRQTTVDRAAAEAKAHPEEAARIAAINNQLRNTPSTGRPEDADARAALLKERDDKAKSSGLSPDLTNDLANFDRQTAEIQKVITATKAGTDAASTKLSELDQAANDGFATITRTLSPLPERIGAHAAKVNDHLTNLGSATEDGFKAMGAQIAAVQASLSRTITQVSANLQSQINGL